MTRLAVIVPYYKITFFKETLLSLENQADRRFSLYIGNDASPDDPENLIREILQDIPFQYFNYADNLGGKNLALQWERILENVTEEWFHILGDDDVISKNFVEQFYTHIEDLEKNGCNVVKYALSRIDDEGEIIDKGPVFTKLTDPIDNFMGKFTEGKLNSLSEHIFRKSKFDLYGFKKFPLAWAADDLAILEFSEEKAIYYIDEAKVLVRVSGESISGQQENMPEKLFAIYLFEQYVIRKFYTRLPKQYLRKLINQQISYAYKNKQKLKINLARLYLYLKDYKKLLELPKTYYYLAEKKK